MEQKMYDVSFTLDRAAIITVAANSAKEAKAVALEELKNMTDEELAYRLWAAATVGNVKITKAVYLDTYTEEEEA